MASPALAAVASRHSRFLFRERVSTPSVVLEDIGKGGVCASLCVEASQKSVFLSLAVLRAKIFEEHSWPCTFWNYGPPSLKRALSLLADSHSRARHRLTGHVVVSWCEGR